MTNIDITLIKKLRNLTKASIMECKQALINTDGDIQLAISNMKQSGIQTAKIKSKRITQKGIILIKMSDDKEYGIILELNCETDFVSKNDIFKAFGNTLITYALTNKITDISILNNQFYEKKNMLISLFKENINIHRLASLQGTLLEHYSHNTQIGVIVSGIGANNNKQLLKYIAMHIAACNPKYITFDQIPIKLIEQERNIQINIAQKLGKSNEITKKIAEGRVHKIMNEMSLMNQEFIMDTKKNIKEILDKNHIKIKNFIRLEVGEN